MITLLVEGNMDYVIIIYGLLYREVHLRSNHIIMTLDVYICSLRNFSSGPASLTELRQVASSPIAY